jgi:hypothetical protein
MSMDRDWFLKTMMLAFTVAAVIMTVLVLFPSLGHAETTGETPVPDLGGFWSALGERHWPLAIGLGVTLLVWASRSFVVHKLPKESLPWVTLVLAIIGTGATRMVQSISGGVAWWQGMVQGVLEGATMGFAAMGWWDIKQTVRKRAPGLDPKSHPTADDDDSE